MAKFRDYLQEQLKDEEFKKKYDRLEPEFNIVQAVIDARKQSHFTQKKPSEKTGIAQSDIGKLENGNSNPTISMLQRLADGMNMQIRLEFIPKSIKS